MLLRSWLATAALTLLLATTASADATQRVVNGGFEDGAGSDAPPWTLNVAAACTAADCVHSPASGSRYAATLPTTVAPFGFQTAAIIKQTVLVPETPATLTFTIKRTPSGDGATTGVDVKLGGTSIKTLDTFSGEYETISVVIPAAAASPVDQDLEFRFTCSNSTNNTLDCDRFDLDNVSLISGSPPSAPVITATDPASPADNTTPRVRGTVGGAPTQVSVYTNATCAGAPAATGSAADFTGAGIPVTVPDGATTVLSARSTNLAGDSGCSNSFSYVELGAALPLARPATGLSELKSRFVVGRLGVLVLGKGANVPISSTAQKLTVGGGVIGRGKTSIPAGATKSLKLTLNRKGKRLLRKRKKLRAQLTIVAKGPTGLTDTVTKTVKVVLKRPRR